MAESSLTSYESELPLTKGIIAAFNEFKQSLHKLVAISSSEEILSQNYTFSNPEFKKIASLFFKIEAGAQNDPICSEFIDLLKDIPEEQLINSENQKQKETFATEFCQSFGKIQELIERKLAMPFNTWKQVKKDAMEFAEIYEKLEQELEDARKIIEKNQSCTNDEMESEREYENNEQQKMLTSEDFETLHPFFIIANMKEHIETSKIINDRKIQTVREEEKVAEKNFKLAETKHKSQILNIMQETVDTKSFYEWLEKKNLNKMNEYEESVKEIWIHFSSEMEQSRNLYKQFEEKNVVYSEIKREKAEEAAAILIQAHWRGYITRKSLKEKGVA